MTKTKTSMYALLAGVALMYACKDVNTATQVASFKFQARLDSLKNGSKDFGDPEINAGIIRELQYQKKFNVDETNGVVIPKSLVNQSINGFTETGIVTPVDTSNYAKWDFLVVYPGLSINDANEEKLEPVVFYYKGKSNSSGEMVPVGNPISGIKLQGGGGGDGVKALPPPPPTPPN